MLPTILYCYDAYCGWSYGFSPVISRIYHKYKDVILFETLSGGMIPIESTQHISRMSSYISDAYKKVENLTGIEFGEDYLWHIHNPDKSDWHPCSEKPAIAMAVFRDYHPDETVDFAMDMQRALHFEGRDLTDNEAYRHLLIKYNIPEEEFYKKLASEEYKEKAYFDFMLVKQLKVSGFPAVFMQVGDAKFYALSQGFVDFETLSSRIDKVLSEVEKAE